MTHLACSLSINQLTLAVSLGWPDHERLEKQTISLSFTVQFATPPLACNSDQLKDTVCYSLLIRDLRKLIETKTYHLIEHLGHDAYQHIKNHLQSEALVKVSVLKHPAIDGLMGGVMFTVGDAFSC